MPAGPFDAPRGSLAGAGPWNLTPAAAQRIIAANSSRAADIPFDYEHALLGDGPAPASGWGDPRSFRYVADGEEPGLYCRVKWNDRAAQLIGADEYRYLSPVFPYDPQTGEPLDLLHVALTNFPGIDEPIRAALSARSAIHYHNQENPVNEVLKKLLATLGLPETTAEADAFAGLAALKAKADAATVEIAALKAGGATAPDPSKYVPIGIVQDMQTQLAALSGRLVDDEAGRVIEQAIAAGKLVEGQRQWAADLGKTNLAALKSYVDTAPAIAALAGMQSKGKEPPKGDGQLSESELAVCKAMGLSREDFIKSKEA